MTTTENEKLIALLTSVDNLLCDLGMEITEDGADIHSIDYIPAIRNKCLEKIESLRKL